MRNYCRMDVECYQDYFLIKFGFDTGVMVSFPKWPGKELNILDIMGILQTYTVVTFNGNHYDMPMVTLALTGVDTYALKAASDAIIKGGLKSWHFYREYGLTPVHGLDHIDLMEVAPGVGVSLKMYAGRQHSEKMQDLPIAPDASIAMFDRVELDKYCGNDLQVTHDLQKQIKERIALRELISETYAIDVRSKSDAQIAEAVVKARLGFNPEKRIVPNGHSFHYVPPTNVKFATQKLRDVLATICAAPVVVYDTDQLVYMGEDIEIGDGKKIKTGIKLPATIKDLRVTLGGSVYQMGIGGLHSQESRAIHYTLKDVCTISDHDVKSFYPSLILALKMFPPQLGETFLTIYRELYDERLTAKAKAKQSHDEKLQLLADVYKIVLNGTFGKLGSKYSIFFAPELLIQTTITGQLYLLMLIERMEMAGISVVSANTDGIVIRTPWGKEPVRDRIITQWQNNTGMETEATFYNAIYSRDVNNYIAFKTDGSHKGKGIYTESGVATNKNPCRDICSEAVIAYLKDGTLIEQTICECQDVRKFLVIRAVKGGGVYVSRDFSHIGKLKTRAASLAKRIDAWRARGDARKAEDLADELQDVQADLEGAIEERRGASAYLGKAVRWYHSTCDGGYIASAINGNLVATSEGAMPAMILPESIPDDIDRNHYVREACRMLADLGVNYP